MITKFLRDLPPKELLPGRDVLDRAGISPDDWYALETAGAAAIRRLLAAWPKVGERDTRHYVFDKRRMANLFGLDAGHSDPAPFVCEDHRVVYVPPNLCACNAENFIKKAPLHDGQDWRRFHYSAKPGYWEVVCPIRFDHVIPDGFQPTPACVNALFLSAYNMDTSRDPLRDKWVFCAEELPNNRRVALTFADGLLFLGDRVSSDQQETWNSVARWLYS